MGSEETQTQTYHQWKHTQFRTSRLEYIGHM